MTYLATVTSKMQLTLPAAVARQIGLKQGQKVSVSQIKGKIIITPVKSIIYELAGSLPLPKKWEGKSIDEIISESKLEHFKK